MLVRGLRREIMLNTAARPGRNRSPVWASSRVVQKRADFIRSFGRENVLELAGLLFDFSFAVHGQAVCE